MGTKSPSPNSLKICLNRLSASPLKPYQKLEILQNYLLPRYFYSLQSPKINGKILAIADKAVRRFVKGCLHLPITTPNAFLYTDKRGGGLGITCFKTKIPDILYGRIKRLYFSDDQQIQALLNSEYINKFKVQLENLLRVPGIGGTEQRGYWRGILQRSFSGAGLPEHCGRSYTSCWISKPPPFWNGSDYVSAMQLRTNTLPTRGGLHNCKIHYEAKRCRAGCERVETLSHILQRCPLTHYERIRKHDHAAGLLGKFAAREGWLVVREPSMRDANGILHKPDMIISKNEKVIVIDVSINWETPRPLSEHWYHKVATYTEENFISAVQQRYPGSAINVTAIVLGARGTWCALNDRIVKQVGLSNLDRASLVTDVMKGSTLIHGAFNRLVWDE